MNTTAALLVACGGIAPIAAVVGALATLWVNRKNAVKVLAEAQTVAQTTALKSNDSALKTLKAQCERCDQRVAKVEKVCVELIIAAEANLADPTPENRAIEVAAVWAARLAI